MQAPDGRAGTRPPIDLDRAAGETPPVSKGIRVVLVEDQPLVRMSVRRLLEADDFEVVAEASDAEGGIEAALREAPDLCLVEVEIPGGGITVTRQITRRLRETTVVMLT